MATKRCSRCRKPKPLSDFGTRRRRGKTEAVAYCNPCRVDYQREWLKKGQNGKRHQGYAATFRRELREWVEATFKQRPCLDCGGEYPPFVLEFDHRDPAQKQGTISHMVSARRSRKAIQEEVAKCDAVCANCHKIRECARRNKLDDV